MLEEDGPELQQAVIFSLDSILLFSAIFSFSYLECGPWGMADQEYGERSLAWVTVEQREFMAWQNPPDVMSISLLITSILIAVFALSVSLGYVIGRTSARAGMAIAAAGLLLGVVLTVNYFEEVPIVVVAASFAAIAASMVFALFELVRKDVAAHPN